jgi:uncharacterized protein YciI
MYLEQGELTVIIIEAKLTRDIETFSKMDPFVKVDWVDSESL